MALNHFFLLALIVGAPFLQVKTASTCGENKHYDSILRQCCGRCSEGEAQRSACIQDPEKDCKNCNKGYFINWDRSPPQCATCNKCKREEMLVEIQSCSINSDAICQCKDGYYCQSPVRNTCARCELHRMCPLGQGVKTKGTVQTDTVCEACPPGTYSDNESATGKCKPHTDCAALQQKTLREGNSMTDTVCETSGHISPNLEKNNDSLGSKKLGKNEGTIPSAGQRYTTPRVYHISATPTASLAMTSTKDEDDITGKWNGGYIVAMIICILSLLVALALVLKQKLCRLKLWIKKKTYFIQPKPNTNKTVLTYHEKGKEQDLLQRQNSAQSQLVTQELYQNMEGVQIERTADDKAEIQQGRDHLNNRIEKIYIMNADTVLVGSISEVPSRSQRSVTVESEEKESLVLESRYPEQESSKMPGSDLMLSIEEEETEGTTAKVILHG